MLSQLLSLAMLIPSDVAALQNGRLLPNQQAAIGTIAAIRPVVLATVTYSQFAMPGTFATATPALSFTFPPNTLQAGNQCRFKIYGHWNDTITGQSIGVQLNASQQSAVVPTGVVVNSPGADVAFIVEGAFSFSQTGGVNLGVANKTGYVGSSQTGLLVGASVSVLQSNSGQNTTTRRGGDLVVTSTRSALVTNNDANTFYLQPDQPITLSVAIFGANMTQTNQGGWLECF